MKKLYTFILGIILLTSYSYSVEYELFTAGEGNKFLQENYNLKDWEVFQIISNWYPNDSTIIFDFVYGRSSLWIYTYRESITKNQPKSWTFLLRKINGEFMPLDFGVEDDDFVVEYEKLPQNWIDSDMLPMAVQANSTLGQMLMENFDNVKEFNVLLTPKYVTEDNYPDGMWWLTLDINGMEEPAYCIFEATTLEKVECYEPQINSVSDLSSNTILCYPNPAKDYIDVKLLSTNDVGNNNLVKIYNYSGECVISENTISLNTSQRIDISSLPEGIYFIKIGHLIKPFVIKR